MVRIRKKRWAAAAAVLSVFILSAPGAALTAEFETSTGDVTAETKVTVQYDDPEGEGYWLLGYEAHFSNAVSANGTSSELCADLRRDLRSENVTWEREEGPDEPASYAFDPVHDAECEALRDDMQRVLYSFADYPESWQCLRPYTPSLGPMRGGSLLPFGICAGTDQERCDVIVTHLGIMCLGGLKPDN